jgi:hypothetical protein
MSMTVRLFSFLILSIAAAYVVDVFGFGLVHSKSSGFLTLLLSPGVVIIFIREGLTANVSWALLVLTNVLYYEAVYRTVARVRRKNTPGHGGSADKPTRTGQ